MEDALRDDLIAAGLERQGAGDLRGASALYRQALRCAGDQDQDQGDHLHDRGVADAWHLWATTALQRGHPRRALALALRAAFLEPKQSWYHNTLGAAYAALGATHEALGCWANALACDPANDAAHLNRGSTLMDLGDPFGALAHFRALVELDPDDAAAHANLGGMLFDLAQDKEGLEEATAHLRQATELGPDLPGGHYNLGLALQKAGDWPGAMAAYARALELAPDFGVAHTCYVGLAAKTCDWAQRDALWARTQEFLRGPDRRGEQVVSPLLVAQQPSTPAEQQEAARRWVAAHPGLCQPPPAGPRRRREGPPHRRRRGSQPLRIGYLSADFREHAVAYQIAEVLELHDRRRVHVTAYDLGPEDARSATRARIKEGTDAFVPLGHLSAEEAARRIAADGTDILIDLGGFTEHCRPEIVARRPAPVQVSYLGFPMTSGAPFLDYVITDRYLTPPSAARHWSERFCYVSGCYMPPDRKKRIAPPREDCGLPAIGQGLVLCCFNSPLKIAPQACDIWMRVLLATPRSVLWLFSSNQWAPTQLRREAEARGVDPERLVFASHHPHAEYLGLLSRADLFLDTWPYGGGATVNDALWAGLPVLTLAGQTYVSRMAASQLRAIGLPQLVTRTPGGYERAALDLAGSPRLLQALRAALARNRESETWPLFDTPRYVRTLEDAYVRMATHTRAGSR